MIVLARMHAPRGLARIDERMRAAARLVEEGETRRAVAAVYGVSASTVAQWVQRVRDADRDERLARPRSG